MNRIAGRSGIAMLLVLVLIGGLVFFVGEYFLEADDWINAAGSPHVYNGGNIGCGLVTDREGRTLMDVTDVRTYADSETLRAAMIHWLGDREEYQRSCAAALFRRIVRFRPFQRHLFLFRRRR